MQCEDAVMAEPTATERIRGCLLGGAVGDALGAEIGFSPIEQIRAHHGPDGVTGYVGVGGIGSITDDTQMTLFTAEGLIRADNRHAERWACDVPAAIHRAYLRWLLTQDGSPRHVPWEPEFTDEPSGWLVTERALWAWRAPGTTCLNALRSGQMGSPDRVINDSKGCGGVMRVAPIGLVAARPFELAVDAAAITHTHPTGYLAAGAFAEIIARITYGEALRDAMLGALDTLRGHDHAAETIDATTAALALADREPDPNPEIVERLGSAWIAEEALSIACYCALAARDFRHGVLTAVNHSGDSDSTGSMCGNLLGAATGTSTIPQQWIDRLAEHAIVEQIADDLATHFIDGQSLHDTDRYPTW
jgi:ADP-ribosyl-[dinitrogen reductase] hydrolase